MQQAASELNFERAAPAPVPMFAGCVVILMVLIFPVLLYLGHLAPHGRILYPVTNVALAGYLFMRRSPWYVAHCVLLFCFVSLVRRLIDEQSGWDPSNPVLLTPYLCCLISVFGFFSYWSRPTPRHFGPYLAVLLCVAYGTAIAALYGRMFGGLVDTLKWSIGPIFAVYMLSEYRNNTEIRRVVEGCLVWVCAFMGLYGIFQFINPASWDVEWMRDVLQIGFDSIGRPEPFGVRVFGTLNSPGSLGIFLSVGIILALKRSVPVVLLTIPFMIGGLALCQYRSIWAATALAVLMIVLSRGAALRPANGLALLAIFCVLCSTAIVPRIHEAVIQRASSIKALKGDASLETRLQQYASLTRNDQLIVGEGLAINGASRRLDKKLPVAIDSAFIEIARALGVITGTIFLVSMAVPVFALFGPAASIGNHVYFDRAIVAATALQLPMGSVHIGELGFCAWMFCGLGLAAQILKAEEA